MSSHRYSSEFRTEALREFCVNELCTVLHGDAN